MGAQKNGNNVILTTDADKVIFADLKNKKSCYNYANCISGTFQASNLVCSILVSNGKVINNSSAHSWLGYPDSCLIYYTDGTFDVKRLLAIPGDELKKVKWAISGVGLLDMYNPAAEGYAKFTKNGKSYNYSDVLRRTNHTAIGVDANGKVYGLYLSNMTGSGVNAYCQKLGLKKAVMLDGGHIASVNCDAAKINTKQLQSNIVQFVFDNTKDETNNDSKGNKTHSVVIDPGHGQSDPGAIGRALKLKEKDVVLKLGKKVQSELERHGVKVYMTRTDDNRIIDNSSGSDLSARANFANKQNAEIYVSLHNNSSTSTQPNGIETYCCKFGANAEKLAKAIQEAVVKETKGFDLPDRGVKEANFVVLRETSMPAALIELGFISNGHGEILLNEDEFLDIACVGIVKGILKYFGMTYVEQPKTKTIHRVQVGAFSNKENANRLLDELNKNGYQGFIVSETK